jgi:hypothetical protein
MKHHVNQYLLVIIVRSIQDFDIIFSQLQTITYIYLKRKHVYIKK